jgi:CubicO group peptidase (beta-lactamase class C family)
MGAFFPFPLTPNLYSAMVNMGWMKGEKMTNNNVIDLDAISVSIDDYIQSKMEKLHLPSVSIAVIQEGNVVKKQSYGLANIEHSIKASPDTVYQLGSLTKQFTAIAIMMLVSDGKLSLEDKIVDILPDLPTAWKDVNVRHLLNHTSGIKSYTSTETFEQTLRKDYTHQEIIDLVANEPMEFAPGANQEYNNTGFFLLGMIIEKVTDKTYNAFLTKRIFQPLGMTQTRLNDLQDIIPNRAQGYKWEENTIRHDEFVSPTQPFSAGALVSTINDMIKWDAALRTDKILPKSVLEEMWTPTKLNNGGVAPLGFGWNAENINEHRLISHGGGIQGFRTFIARFVDDKLTVIVLINANNENGDPWAIAQSIAQRYLPALFAPKPPAVEVAREMLDTYTGYYNIGGSLHTSQLQMGFALSVLDDPWELVPISGDTFYWDNTEEDSGRKMRWVFTQNEAGQVKKYVFSPDGQHQMNPLRIGPLASALAPESDPDPTLTQGIEATLKIYARGMKSTDVVINITPRLRKDLGGFMTMNLAGIQSITYIATQNIEGQNLVLHDGKVSRVLYYKLHAQAEAKTENASVSRYVLVYLTEDNLITDFYVVAV